MRARADAHETGEPSPDRRRLETSEPDDLPVAPAHEDPDDPDYLPEEDDEYPSEEEEYASPAVAPHEEPLVTA